MSRTCDVENAATPLFRMIRTGSGGGYEGKPRDEAAIARPARMARRIIEAICGLYLEAAVRHHG